MKLEQQFYQHLRSLGYWNHPPRIHPTQSKDALTLAWSNPNTTADPDTMYRIIWLLSSTNRRQRLCGTDRRILNRAAIDLVREGDILSATRLYIKYLWEQVQMQELAQQLPAVE